MLLPRLCRCDAQQPPAVQVACETAVLAGTAPADLYVMLCKGKAGCGFLEAKLSSGHCVGPDYSPLHATFVPDHSIKCTKSASS